jgi:Family of unknown function (DUF5754)
MKIIRIEKSHIKNKRFRVYLDDGEHYDFGFQFGSTYLDHKNKEKRENYWKRHLGNNEERHLIETLTPSPALFSALLLWGNQPNLKKNIEILNNLFKQKDDILKN